MGIFITETGASKNIYPSVNALAKKILTIIVVTIYQLKEYIVNKRNIKVCVCVKSLLLIFTKFKMFFIESDLGIFHPGEIWHTSHL